MTLHALDWLVVVAYLVTVLVIGLHRRVDVRLERLGRGVRDYRLWLGLVLAITTALFYVMR